MLGYRNAFRRIFALLVSDSSVYVRSIIFKLGNYAPILRNREMKRWKTKKCIYVKVCLGSGNAVEIACMDSHKTTVNNKA